MTNPVPTFEDLLDTWLKVKREAKNINAQEMQMRKALAAAAFPAPKEGANSLTLADGRIFKVNHKINRSVDEAALDTVIAQLTELRLNDVAVDDLFPIKRGLSVGKYKALPDEARRIADLAITAKPGSPEVEVV